MAPFRKIDNYYVWGIKGIIFLMPLIPLYVTPSIVFPYITGKNFAFRAMVEFAAALWIVLISINKEYRLHNSAIIISVLIFTFIAGLADLLGVSPYNSFWSNYERMEGYITILHLTLYFLIVRSVIRTRKEWITLLNIFLVISFLVSIYALIAPLPDPDSSQFSIEYGRRVYGTIGNPPFLASYLLLSVFFGFFLISNTQRLYLKLIYLFFIIINCLAIYFSASRGVMLAALIGGMVFSLLYVLNKSNASRKKLARKATLSVIGAIVILSLVFLIFRNTNFIKHDRALSRLTTIFSDPSVRTRFEAWNLAWNGFKARPLLGWGQENFISVYTVNPIPLANDYIWLDRAHNLILDWLVNAGLPGLLSYMAIYACTLYMVRDSFRKKIISSNEMLIITTAVIAYFIQNQFTFDTINTYLLFFTLLAYIDNINPEKVTDLKEFTDPKKNNILAVYLTLLSLSVFSAVFYYLNYKPLEESRRYIQIRNSFPKTDSYSQLLDEFNNALSLETFGDNHVRQGMKSVSSVIIRNKLFSQEGALQIVDASVRELEEEMSVNTHNLKYLSDVIKFYSEIAAADPSFINRTEALIEAGLRLNPEYQWLYMALADVCVMKKDYEGAFNNVKKIVDMDPQNDKKQFKLALAAIHASKDDIAIRALEDVRMIRTANNTAAYGDKSIFSFNELYQTAVAYKKANNTQKALHYFGEAILILPLAKELKHASVRGAIVHFETAMLYLELGDKEKAAMEIFKAKELDPKNFADAEDIIYTLNNKIKNSKNP